MINVQAFVFNPFQENTYLLINEHKQCWIVDPGMYTPQETNQLITYITHNALQPQAIINTHAHIDHIFGVNALMAKFAIPFGLHEKELPVLNNARGAAMLWGFDIETPAQPSFIITENMPLQLGNDEIDVRFTPGHSPGSIIFYYSAGNWVIGGDVLFQGSIGRTDLPGGNFDTLMHSIHTQLLVLPDNVTVFPGHGPATSIGRERSYNPFLQ